MRLLATLLVLSACTGEPRPLPAMPDSSQTIRVGRVTVDLPASARWADGVNNGGTHSWTPILEEPWPRDLPALGDDRDDARAADWARRVADAQQKLGAERERARIREQAAPHLVLRDESIDVEGADWARVLLWPDYAGTWTNIVAVADIGTVRLVSQDRFSTSAADRVVATTADVLGAYVADGATGQGGARYGVADWLYFRHGAITRAPTEKESVGYRFVGHPVFSEITVSMDSRVAPLSEPSLLERWRETQGVGVGRALGGLIPKSMRPQAREVRAGAKSAGTLAGEEVVSEFRVEAPSGPGTSETGGALLLEWEYIGTPNQPGDPDVSVTAETEVGPPPTNAETDAALAAWDAILGSLRLMPNS